VQEGVTHRGGLHTCRCTDGTRHEEQCWVATVNDQRYYVKNGTWETTVPSSTLSQHPCLYPGFPTCDSWWW
jgi:hypothetical protein